MKGITIKLPEETLARLQKESRETGLSIAALVRRRLEEVPSGRSRSAHALSADLAGSVSGSRRAATNSRRKFRRA